MFQNTYQSGAAKAASAASLFRQLGLVMMDWSSSAGRPRIESRPIKGTSRDAIERVFRLYWEFLGGIDLGMTLSACGLRASFLRGETEA